MFFSKEAKCNETSASKGEKTNKKRDKLLIKSHENRAIRKP